MNRTINAAPANSRYHGLKIVTVVRADGAEVACLERRFRPIRRVSWQWGAMPCARATGSTISRRR